MGILGGGGWWEGGFGDRVGVDLVILELCSITPAFELGLISNCIVFDG